MHILLVDDETQCADAVAQRLETDNGHQVTLAANPAAAVTALSRSHFDVVINDILYIQSGNALDERYEARALRPDGPGFIKSGLWTIRYLHMHHPDTGIVVWTAGGPERRLHLRYAYEEYGVRVFCSKSSPTGQNDKLQAAIVSAAAGHRYVDGSIQWYVAVDGQQPLRENVLRKAARGVLRCMALGIHDYDEIARITGYKSKSMRSVITKIADECIQVIQPAPGVRRKVKEELIAFASANRQFFADEAVREDYPHEKQAAN